MKIRSMSSDPHEELDEKLPIDDIYDMGLDIGFEEQLYEQLNTSWNPSKDVDWDQSIDLDSDAKRLTSFLATEFHYDSMFELMLCGRLLEKDAHPEAKVLAVMLANSKIRNAAAWAKYLANIGDTEDLSHAKRRYFGALYDEEDTTNLLLGISVIGDVSWYAFMDKVEDVGGPLFEEIVSSIREQKRGQISHTVNYLQYTTSKREGEQLRALRKDAEFFRDSMEEIIQSHDDKLAAVGKDTDAIAQHVVEYIDTFYTRIGMTPPPRRSE